MYHCKLHLYRLRILVTISLDFNIISCLFELNLVFFSSGIYFSLVLFRAFRFLRPVKELRIRLRPPEKF